MEDETILPSQWEAWVRPGRERDSVAKLKWALMQEAHATLMHMAPKLREGSTRALTRLLNLMAWVEDMDGERARRAGIPYRFTFRDVCESVFQVEAEAGVRAFRGLFREVRGQEERLQVARRRPYAKRWQPAA